MAKPSQRWKPVNGPSSCLAQMFQRCIGIAVGFDKFDYRRYSLRRGGATNHFKVHGRFDALMVLGRWQSSATARIYANDGMSVLTEMSVPWTHFTRNLRSQYLTSLTKPLQKLELTKAPSQKRGRWKRGATKETLGKCFTKGWRSSTASGFGRGLGWPYIPEARLTLGLAGFSLGYMDMESKRKWTWGPKENAPRG